MKTASLLPLWPVLLLPLLMALAFNISPQPYHVSLALHRANWAEDHTNPGAASRHLDIAAEALPWRADLFERAGQDALAAGEQAAAIEFYEAAEQRGTLSREGIIGNGEAHFQTGDIERAIQLWDTLAGSSHPPLSVYSHLADARLQLGDLSGAIDDLRMILEASPEDPAITYRLGQLLAVDQPDEAIPVLLEAARLDPQYESSVRTLQAVMNRIPDDTEPAYRLLLTGRGLGAVHSWEMALLAFERAAGLRPDYAEAWAFLGEARQQLGQDGADDLKQALELDSMSVLVQALNALYWQRQGKPEIALQHLHNAANEEPENPVWQYELGNVYAAQGNLAEAMSRYKHATDLAPEDPIYWRALAELSIVNGYALEDIGIPAARQAMILAPKDPGSLDLMGQALLKDGDYLSAERFLHQALSENPDFVPAHLHLGIALFYQGKVEAAYPCFLRASTLAPEGWEGEQAQRFLRQYYPQY